MATLIDSQVSWPWAIWARRTSPQQAALPRLNPGLILSLRDRGKALCAHVAGLIDEHARNLADRIRHLQQMQGELRQLSVVARSSPRAAGKFCHIIELARPS